MEESSVVNNVARAIMAALAWDSSPHDRNSAFSYLESITTGDIRALASTSFALVKKDWSTEIRLHALKMLQHLVRLRWDELSPTERWEFASVAVGLMSEIANSSEEWALKSQMAALVAEMVRREGLNLWQELAPSLISLSNSGPMQSELVSMMLRWLPEDITVHNEDLEGDRRRLLLSGLTQSLPEIFPLLYTLLERHFVAAVNEAGRQQLDIAKQHAASVLATLNAINAYAEWAPVPDLLKYGIISGCSFLLSSPDFRLLACEFFQLVSPRKRPVDESASEFDTAVRNIFQILMNVSRDFLFKSRSNATLVEASEYEFAECICKSMVSLGSSNLQCINEDTTALSFYLEQMLGYYQHKKLVLHYRSLSFWVALMRDLATITKIVAHTSADGSVNVVTSGTGQGVSEKRNILPFIRDDVYSCLLEIAFQRVLKKERVNSGSEFFGDSIELWSDDFEGNGDFGQYRSKLLELIRFVTIIKPLTTASKVYERVMTIIHSDSLAAVPEVKLAVMESMVSTLDNIVSAVFDGYDDFSGSSAETQLALCRIFESLLQQLLSLKWTEPAHVEVLGHYIDAIGPFLRYFPDAVGSVINKLFELLNSLPFAVKDPSTSVARHARLQICTSFIRLAKAADKNLLPHMKGIADTMAYLQKEGCLLRAEHNILGEAFLVMASAAGIQQQQEVLAWFLEPLSKEWTQLEWQNAYLSDSEGLVRLCSNTQLMWSLFHTVTFFEKALKRGGLRKGPLSSHNSSTEVGSNFHPLASHLSWMIPPLLKLLRALHSFWSPPVIQVMPREIKAALVMSDAERTLLLGEANIKFSKIALSFPDESRINKTMEGHVQLNETDIRNWLKGIRDSGYNVLGLSATIGNLFFKYFDIHAVSVALMENIQYMEFRHIRQLVHLVLIPLVKCCPLDMWEEWIEKLLRPLLLHSQQALSFSWSSLLQEGRANVPDLHGVPAGSDLKVEVIEEKLLRDLAREICSLLSVVASSGLNPGLPSIEQSGQVIRLCSSSLKDLDAFASNSMIGFVLNHKDLALPALQITLDAFKWNDGEAGAKVSSFCGAIVRICTTTNNKELLQYVAKDLFYAIIEGLFLESNVFISSDLVGLCREIFMYLSNRHPGPRQILMSLPCVTPQDLLDFEEAIAKTASPKEQKQHMKSFLILATGNKLKALAAQKSVNVITNVSARPRSVPSAPESKFNEGDAIGLAAIL